jgi:hypothetical protein
LGKLLISGETTALFTVYGKTAPTTHIGEKTSYKTVIAAKIIQ